MSVAEGHNASVCQRGIEEVLLWLASACFLLMPSPVGIRDCYPARVPVQPTVICINIYFILASNAAASQGEIF